MKVVTSGSIYIDIDAYAGCIAYAELLNLQGEAALAASSATWNESITNTIRSWNAPLKTDYLKDDNDTFILIDVSDPEHFDTFVNLKKIEEVIDHHPSFEAYWKDQIGDRAQIDFIGSAATLVSERWERAGLLSSIKVETARLLIAAILDNTLNFGAYVTTDRDRTAYNQLLKIADLPEDWTSKYFQECQASILSDVGSAIKNDSKLLKFTNLPAEIAVGQLVIWDAEQVLNNHQATIKQAMDQKKPEWILNLVSVGESKSYFICQNDEIKKWAGDVLGVTFEGSLAIAGRLWLRKEIIKQDMQEKKL